MNDNCRSHTKGHNADNECEGTDSFPFEESPPGLFLLWSCQYDKQLELLDTGNLNSFGLIINYNASSYISEVQTRHTVRKRYG